MSLKNDLQIKINEYLSEPYDVEETSIVPDTDYSKLTFNNKGLTSELCFLFVDIRQSSQLHIIYGYKLAAKIYQSFHDVNVRLIEANNGNVRAFDGDRIMGVFAGEYKNCSATKSAMQIISAVRNFLNVKLSKPIVCGAGIDYGVTLITKVGKGRDPNNYDLVWVGQASNYASHYCQEANDSVIISERSYNVLDDDKKYLHTKEKDGLMWAEKFIELKNGQKIKCYETKKGWEID
jgi:class 3 adenylate cyclase